jgi:hypothetical protein
MTVLDRLALPPGRDFDELLAAYRSGRVPRIPADLRAACAAARARPASFENHGPVLALSIGGSNSAAMLCENRGGRLHVHAAVRRPNPATPRPWGEFLDELLAPAPALLAYLREHPAPEVGVTIAVPFVDGVPGHASKIATLQGLIARGPADTRASHHFPTNFAAWLAARGLRPARVTCEGDAPVAHLGGLAAIRTAPGAPSLLLVCGTGMACADEKEFILPGLAKLLVARDPALYRADETEDGQYQYLCAGKGLYRVLRRALLLAAAQPGSPLAAAPAPDWLAGAADTKLVYQIWQYTLPARAGAEPPAALAAIRAAHAPAAWAAVEAHAAAAVRQAAQALSAALVGALADRADCAGREVTVFVEGGIARNADVFAAARAAAESDLARLRALAPESSPTRIRWCLAPDAEPTGAFEALACLDQTLHGAAALAFARPTP